MARTKKITRRRSDSVVTWTRFHLPVEREWPTWAVDHKNVHFGPLEDLTGVRKGWLGRMVEDPEQAAYIIEWEDLEHLKQFWSSPACAAFLQNLPENGHSSQLSRDGSSSEQSSSSVENALSSSSPASRFLTLRESTQRPKSDVEGRVTFNAFLVPHKQGHETTWNAYHALRDELCSFQPRGFEFIAGTGLHWEWYMNTWFFALEEDQWVQNKFGKSEQTDENTDGRTVICEFHLWPQEYGATPEHEEASASDPEATASWNEAVAKVMPPVTAWVQERWDVLPLPYYEPPYEPTEEELEHQRKLEEFIKYHRENPEPEVRWCGTRF
ncbi:Putative protein of unknown function [Podospora comata]|uniref:ABM domain-containing protein n=1 Tax=Podospora comata TaxID=48703 RepID=A0ABY6SGN5_PODCO|nr:Putative protein of unknown function [Podospora comata]